MTIDTSGNVRLSLLSPDLRGHIAQVKDNPGSNAVLQRGTAGQPPFKEVLIQSFTQMATSTAAADQTTPEMANDSITSVSDQALANFVQDLFAVLGRNASGTGSIPPPPEGSGLTKEALASSLEDIRSPDSNRYDRNLALLNNFDTADSDGDGAISHDEAHAFNEANSIPTIEGGPALPPARSANGRAYPPTFGAQMSVNIQDLILQLASANETSATNSSLASDGADPPESDPLLKALETSYGNLMSAFGGDSSSGSLTHFLVTLKDNLNSLGSAGNVVNTAA